MYYILLSFCFQGPWNANVCMYVCVYVCMYVYIYVCVCARARGACVCVRARVLLNKFNFSPPQASVLAKEV